MSIDNIKTILYFFKIVRRICPGYITKSIISSIFKAMAPFINIIIPKLILDELMGNQDRKTLILYVGLLVIGNFIFKLINSYFVKVMLVADVDFNNKLSTYLNIQCVEMDFENVENPDILDLKEKAFFAIYNLNAVGQTLEHASTMISQIITLLGLGYILTILNPLIILIILLIVCLNGFMFKKIEKLRYEDNQQSIYDNRAFGYFCNLTSEFSMGKDIRLYNAAPLLLKRMKYFMDNSIKIYSKEFTLVGKYTGITNVNLQFQMVLIYGYLVWKVIKGHIGLGSFTMYANAVRSFSTAIMSCIYAFIEINQLCMYLELFIKFENIESKNAKGTLPVEELEDFTIEFRNVSFKYPGKKDYTLKNISIKIKPGIKLSLVGLNGAGKTTFIKLLSRLYEPTEGDILLGGVDIREYKYEEYMKLLAIVFQDFKLLSYTIRENFMSNSNIGEDQILQALKKAGFKEDLEKLEKGLETNLYRSFDNTGVEFSGGQSQKIAIARALCKDAPIVIFDEPTSALDPISEYEIYHSFNQLVEGKTAIYISHRLSSTRFSDYIAVFKDGEIIEYGSHQELVQKQESLYANMYQTQAQYYVG